MALKIDHVSKKFLNNEKSTLEDISLTIEDGEFICLIGPSGCGKSTLLNLIAGLEKPTSGAIYINDKKVEEPGSDRVVMFQESALFPWLNVTDNVKFGLKLHGVDKNKQDEIAEKYLKMVNLYEHRDKRIHELSGGMKQRVAMARALTMDSPFLLMDEPFAALDKQTRNILRDEIHQIWCKTGKTIIFVTHSVEEAIFFADRIVMISKGTIAKNIKVDIERPREIDSTEFIHLRKELLAQLRKEVEEVE